MATASTDLSADVVVAGGGPAGLATAIHLSRRGWHVVCSEPRVWPRSAVGESLEFSAGGLLADLGVEVENRGDAGHLYPKTSVRVVGRGVELAVWPPQWFARPPIWCSRRAFHCDRVLLDERLREVAIDAGVEILPERVTGVDHDTQRIEAMITDRGRRLTARWFVDASGHTSRLVGRALDVPRDVLGQSRSAYWMRIDQPPEGHATTLYFPETSDDLVWVWEIPLNDEEISVGVVMPQQRSVALRADGLRPREIFDLHLASIPRLDEVRQDDSAAELHATTYTPYRHERTVGPNWVMVGDAAALVDPLTSNGVTAALRQATRAARTVSDALDRGRLRRRDAWSYRHTAPATIATLERAIETFIYDPAVRDRLGFRRAVTAFAATSVVTNSLYTKLSPTTVPRSVACAAVLTASRAWADIARRTINHTIDRAERPVLRGAR